MILPRLNGPTARHLNKILVFEHENGNYWQIDEALNIKIPILKGL